MGDITLVGAGHVILGLVLTLDVLLTKQRPVSSVLWIAVVWGLPYLGALAYLSLGVDRVRRGGRAREMSRAMLERRAALHPRFEPATVDAVAIDPVTGVEPPGYHIFRATDPAVRPTRVLAGNRVRLLVDGDEFYPALFDSIAKARHSIHLQTFIYARGRIGGELLDLLVERARAGIEVRLLYDRFGSTFAHLTRYFGRAQRAGVRVHSISQANPLIGNFQINLRNHRKLAVIDGQRAYVGGINISDPNHSHYAGGRPIRDYHVEVEGPAVADIQFQFLEDWFFASGEPPEPLLEPEYFPHHETVGPAFVQVTSGGPETRGRGLAEAVFAALVAADRSIRIVTPYFVPDEPIVQAIRYAAHRGVDIRLVVPKKNNHWYIGWATRALYAQLLEAGVRIFERRPPFMHAKALVVDGVYAMMGSANLDYRSLHLSFETNLEIGDPSFAETVLNQVEQEIEHGEEIIYAKHQRRALPRRLIESFCYLFQPLL